MSGESDDILNAKLASAKAGVDGIIDFGAVVKAMPKCGSARRCEAGRTHGVLCPLNWGECGWQSESGEKRRLK